MQVEKTFLPRQRFYLSALQVHTGADGALCVPAAPLTSAALTTATRHYGAGILVQGVHFIVVNAGEGFEFINRECLVIARKAIDYVLAAAK